MNFESQSRQDAFRLVDTRARSRSLRMLATFDARSAAVLLSISGVLPLPLIAVLWPSVLRPNTMGWLALVWAASAAMLIYTAVRRRLTEKEFGVIGTIGIFGQALTPLLMADAGTAMAVLALLVVIPTLAATSRSMPMLLWMVSLALGSAITVTALRTESPADLLVGIGVFVGAITIPVLLVARLRAALYQQVEHQTALNGLDPLTGLLNRRGLFRRASQLLMEGDDTRSMLGVLLMDIDHFKRINDLHGHATGDTSLQAVAAGIQDSVPLDSLVCRYGGEEFLVLLGVDEPPQISAIAERVRTSIEAKTSLTLSIGVACAPGITASDRDPSTLQGMLEYLIQQADRCVYEAKTRGRNRTEACVVDLPNPLLERTPPSAFSARIPLPPLGRPRPTHR